MEFLSCQSECLGSRLPRLSQALFYVTWIALRNLWYPFLTYLYYKEWQVRFLVLVVHMQIVIIASCQTKKSCTCTSTLCAAAPAVPTVSSLYYTYIQAEAQAVGTPWNMVLLSPIPPSLCQETHAGHPFVHCTFNQLLFAFASLYRLRHKQWALLGTWC